MARYTGPSCKLCRREGAKLFLKGDRCYTPKCGFTKRPTVPGQHGANRIKLSEYGLQLREKQKCKRIYGVLETQFSNYFDAAARRKGVTGDNLIQLLENRLDNVIYRLGFAGSRKQARQVVRHSHILVNGKKVNIPSFQVKVGDKIAIKDNSKKLDIIKAAVEASNGTNVPAWLKVDVDNLAGEVISLPKAEELDIPVKEHLIIEFYSKM